MKLDISCIRSILLTIEKYEKYFEPVTFDSKSCYCYNDFLSDFSPETILYHVRYCIQANLITDYSIVRESWESRYDCGMLPDGHSFLSNTRNNENWMKTQKIINKLGDASLKVITSIAEGITTASLNKLIDSAMF